MGGPTSSQIGISGPKDSKAQSHAFQAPFTCQVEPAADAYRVKLEALPKTQLVNCAQVEPLLYQVAVPARSAFVADIP